MPRSAAATSPCTTRRSPLSTGSTPSRATAATCTPTTSMWFESTPGVPERAAENIGTSIHFLPVHQLTAYLDRLAPHQPPLPESERAGREVLSLPLSPAHSDDDVCDAIAALQRVHARFIR